MTAKDVILAKKLGSGGGGGAEITDGIIIKSKASDGSPIEVDYYGAAVTSYTFGWNGYDTFGRNLEVFNAIDEIDSIGSYAFGYCTKLQAIDANLCKAKTISKNAFRGCGNIKGQYVFPNCTSLGSAFVECNFGENGSVKFPKVTALGESCPNGVIDTIEVGSIGNGIVSMRNDWTYAAAYQNIILYCTGDKVDAYLANSRNYGGANAIITIKASENTTYNGVNYSAGDTMVTSTVEATT